MERRQPKGRLELRVTDGWAACPVCRQNRRLLRVDAGTAARGLPVYCRYCKREFTIDVEGGRVWRRA